MGMEDAELGEPGYILIDVEAVLMGKIKVVEQVAIVIMSMSTGDEVLGERYMVYQPMTAEELAQHYGKPVQMAQKSAEAYTRITGDTIVHDDPATNPTWSAVRNRVRKICRRRAIRVYAKGAELERSVFNGAFPIDDLELYGCPKYPGKLHNPLDECRFFSGYVPEIVAMRYSQQGIYMGRQALQYYPGQQQQQERTFRVISTS